MNGNLISRDWDTTGGSFTFERTGKTEIDLESYT